MARVPQRPKRLTRFERKYSLWPMFLCAIPIGIGLAFAGMVAANVGIGLPSLFLAVPVLTVFGFYLVQQRDLAGEKMWRKTRMPLWTRLRFGAERAARTCGYCRDALGEEEGAATCDDCGAVYHVGCRVELNGGCGTVGCSATAPGPVTLKTPKLSA